MSIKPSKKKTTKVVLKAKARALAKVVKVNVIANVKSKKINRFNLVKRSNLKKLKL